jgi:outer membrane protein OmpU
VTLEGTAEMGIVGGTDRDTQFFTDIDVEFILSGETDNGLTFGASIDLDESDASNTTPAFTGTAQGGETIFISGGPHTLTMGDTDGAFDRAVDEVPAGGDIDSVVEHAGWEGNSGLDGFYDGQIARYDYAFDAFVFSFSVELSDDSDNVIPGATFEGNPVYGLGASYTFGDFDIGIGYQMVDWSLDTAGNDTDVDINIIGISGGYTMGDLTIGANYSMGEADIDNTVLADVSFDYTQYALGAAYAMDAWTFAANYGYQEQDDGTDDRSHSGYGLAVHYDLGGGAVIQFGYGFSDQEPGFRTFNNPAAIPTAFGGPVPAGTDTESSAWSFGVSMSF